MFRAWLAWLVACPFLASGCVSAPEALSAPYVHVLLYKVKPGAGDRAVEIIMDDARILLSPLPTVKGLWIGRPVPQAATPEVSVVADYDIGLLLLFDAQKDCAEFRAHPSYVEFQKRHGAKLQTRVIDFSPYGGPPGY